jgi:hypothetical protein
LVEAFAIILEGDFKGDLGLGFEEEMEAVANSPSY